MSKVYQALQRAEGQRRRSASDEVAVLDRAHTAEGNGRHVPADIDEYERLASRIVQARAAAPFTSLLIASPDHGEGTSTVAERLAIALTERPQLRVLLLEANFRTPALAARFELEPAAGLADVLTGRTEVDAALLDTGVPGLRLIAAGEPPDGSAWLLDEPRLPAVLADLAGRCDVVIVDAAPVLPYADTLTLASRVDRVILVTRAERTQRGDLERAKDELEKSGASILGVVLNRKTSHAPPWLKRRLNL